MEMVFSMNLTPVKVMMMRLIKMVMGLLTVVIRTPTTDRLETWMLTAWLTNQIFVPIPLELSPKMGAVACNLSLRPAR